MPTSEGGCCASAAVTQTLIMWLASPATDRSSGRTPRVSPPKAASASSRSSSSRLRWDAVYREPGRSIRVTVLRGPGSWAAAPQLEGPGAVCGGPTSNHTVLRPPPVSTP